MKKVSLVLGILNQANSLREVAPDHKGEDAVSDVHLVESHSFQETVFSFVLTR